MIGQILGGALVSADIAGASWRPVFLVNVPVCLAAAAAGTRVLPEDDQRESKRLDLLGVGVLSLSLLLLVVPLILGASEGWPVWTWICVAVSAPVFVAFLASQRREAGRGGNPLVNVAVVGHAPVLLGLLALLAATGTYYGLLFTLAQYFQQGLHRSALACGLILVPWVACFGLAGQITRRLPPRTVPKLPPLGYLLLTGAYLAIGATLFAGHPGDAPLAALLALGGLGLGIGFATLMSHLTDAVPGDYAPDLSGVSTTLLQIGGTLGVAALGTLYLALAAHGGRSAGHSFAITSLAMGAGALAAAAMAHRAVRTA